jgi:hypothetical protein
MFRAKPRYSTGPTTSLPRGDISVVTTAQFTSNRTGRTEPSA